MQKNIEKSKQVLLKNGYCVLKDLIPKNLIEELKEAIKGQCYYIAKTNNIDVDEDYDLDQIYNLLCSYDRSLGSIIFENIRNLPEFLAIVSSKSIRRSASFFLESKVLFSPPNSNTFRIDKKGEDEHLLNWHQDYTYEFLSNPSLTFWIPIVDVPEELGPPIIISGSHENLKETIFTQSKNMHGRDKIIPVIPERVLNTDTSSLFSDSFSSGDVLVMNTLVVHKSGQNKSQIKNRWTAQIRIGSFDNKEFADRDWSYETSGKFEFFKKLHPKLTKYAAI